MDKVSEPFDYIVERALKEQAQMLAAAVTDGNANDWGEYKYLCGQFRGIHFAMECLKDARRRVGLDGDSE